MEKAQSFATAMNVSTFIATTGFIDRWKRRHSIGMKQISGEEKSVSEEDIRPWLDLTLPELLLKYTPENIYNVDETALFYKLRPDRTLTFKGEKCSGSKKQKDRLTVLVGASMAGEKLPLLVIGKSKSPSCFAGIRSLPLDYISNAKAWMTGNFFQEWLEKWNRKIVSTKRSVLLIIDNCPAHPRNLELSNISIKFLPPNTTAKLQPCDQGIIQSLKVQYRHQLVKKLLSSMDAKEELKITVLDAMQWLKVSWEKVTATTIQNCFHHCSFSLGSNTAEISIVSEEGPESITYEELKSREINVEGSFEEYAIIDNDVPISGILTDNEITAMVQGDVTEEACVIEHDEDDNTIVCPSVSEYRDALKIVKRYVTCNSKSCLLNAINEMEELIYTCSVKQSSLSDFTLANKLLIVLVRIIFSYYCRK